MPVIGTPISAGFAGRYTTAALLRNRFGVANVAKWSDSAAAGTENAQAIEDAIRGAEDEVDAALAGGVYALPLVATDASLPWTVVNAATAGAGYLLYTRRGLEENDKVATKLLHAWETNVKRLIAYRSGYPRQLPGVALRSDASPAVTIVAPRHAAFSADARPNPTWQAGLSCLRAAWVSYN